MADETLSDIKQHHPHTLDGLPILPGPLTPEEIHNEAERAVALADKQADAGYKERQLALTASANRLTAANVRLTWLLAIFTAIGAGAAWYQGVVANRNAQSAKISADAAKSAADTAVATLNEMKTDAQNTLNASNEAMNLDQRAWVGLSELKIVHTDAGDAEQQGFAINSGKTPARDVHAIMGFYVHWSYGRPYAPAERDYTWIRYILKRAWRGEIKQTDYLYSLTPSNPPYHGRLPPSITTRDYVGVPQLKSMGVIPPGNSPYRLPVPYPTIPFQGRFTLIFYGEIRYTDFIGKEERSTEFCYLVPSTSAPEFYPCDKLNDMN